MVALFDDAFLQNQIAMRGGTLLHKVHLAPPSRYSEDMDLVVVGDRPEGHIRKALNRVLKGVLGTPKQSAWADLKLAIRNTVKPSRVLRMTYAVPSLMEPETNMKIGVEANVTERLCENQTAFPAAGALRFKFSTIAAAPTVISATPAGSRARQEDPVRLRFSQPMDRDSVETAFRITPASGGQFQWFDQNRTVEFLPNQPLTITNYAVRLAASARALGGMTLDGNYNGTNQLSPTDDFLLSFSFSVPNDDFANSQSIEGALALSRARGSSPTPFPSALRWADELTPFGRNWTSIR